MRRVVLSVLATSAVVATSLVTLTAPAGAEPGDLDGAYGVCGFTTLAAGRPGTRPAALVRQASGLELAVLRDSFTTWIIRLRVDGTVDPTYGTSGRVVLPASFPLTDPNDRRAWNLAGDRLIVFVATASANSLIALDRNGRIVDTYGVHGVAETGTSIPAATALSDGSFIVADSAQPDGPPHLARITPDGHRDLGYTPELPPIGAGERIGLLESDATDNVYMVVGSDLSAGRGFEGRDVWRLTPGGARDMTFHISVPLPTDPQGVNRVNSITPAGPSLLMQSSTFDPSLLSPWTDVLQEFDHTGSIITSFGMNGTATPTSTPSSMVDVARQPNGGIVVTGRWTNPVDHRVDVFVTAFDANGIRLPGSFRSFDIGQGPNDFDVDTRGLVAQDGYATFGVANGYPESATALTRISLQPLKQGAGLVVGWNGDAWPTRFGNDPGPECPDDTPYWQDWDIARGITTVAGQGGYVGDGFGGIHPFSIGLQRPAPPRAIGSPYWPGWDIVRSIAALPTGTGGYVLDGIGGIHAFTTPGHALPPRIANGPYWPGWDIARGIALMPDGTSGYMVDGFGGIHRFSTPGHALPPIVRGLPYWPGWDIIRGISILPDGTGGYILDGFGGTHPFGIGTNPPPPRPGPNAPYAVGEDWARGFAFIAPIATGVPTISTTSATPTPARSTGSLGARRATARRHGPTPAGPASP